MFPQFGVRNDTSASNIGELGFRFGGGERDHSNENRSSSSGSSGGTCASNRREAVLVDSGRKASQFPFGINCQSRVGCQLDGGFDGLRAAGFVLRSCSPQSGG